jgi:hypothetical protein
MCTRISIRKLSTVRSGVLRRLLFGGLSEASTAKWKADDMCSQSMTFLLDHLYAGAVKEVIQADIAVFTELLNASDKVTQTIIPIHNAWRVLNYYWYISTSFQTSKCIVTKLLFGIAQLIMPSTCTDWLACITFTKQSMTFKTL